MRGDPIRKKATHRLSGTYHLYPQHCCMPVITEEDRTVEAATELLEKTRKEIPAAAKEKKLLARGRSRRSKGYINAKQDAARR